MIMLASSNLLAAWFLIAQIFLGNILSEMGEWLLSVLNMPEPLHQKFGWVVGTLFLIAVLLVIRVLFGELPPGTGKPGEKGYKIGHAMVFCCNLLMLGAYASPLFIDLIDSHNIKLLLASFTISFMYMGLGLFGFGLSFIYQSAIPKK